MEKGLVQILRLFLKKWTTDSRGLHKRLGAPNPSQGNLLQLLWEKPPPHPGLWVSKFPLQVALGGGSFSRMERREGSFPPKVPLDQLRGRHTIIPSTPPQNLASFPNPLNSVRGTPDLAPSKPLPLLISLPPQNTEGHGVPAWGLPRLGGIDCPRRWRLRRRPARGSFQGKAKPAAKGRVSRAAAAHPPKRSGSGERLGVGEAS